jgi:hypothetical protein
MQNNVNQLRGDGYLVELSPSSQAAFTALFRLRQQAAESSAKLDKTMG